MMRAIDLMEDFCINDKFLMLYKHMVVSMDMTLQKWALFIMGVYGEMSHFLSDPTEISFLLI